MDTRAREVPRRYRRADRSDYMDEALLKSGQYPNIAIEAGSDPAEVMREHGRVDNGAEADSREKLETDIMFEYLEFPGDQNRIFAYLDRQAAITRAECKNTFVHFAERLQLVQNGYDAAVRDMQPKVDELTAERVGWDCAECAEGLGKELDARCDPLKERIVELTAERDQLSRDLDAEHALVVQFEHDNEELRHANNTLRASVAGLKMTVERFKARESGDARRSG